MVSDSSLHKAFIYECDSIKYVEEFPFQLGEQQQSSSLRELLAIHRVCTLNPEFFASKANTMIIWVTDSAVMCHFLNKGSRIPIIQKMILDIKDVEIRYNVVLHPHWLPRSNILLDTADFGSKRDFTNDWGIDFNSYIKLTELMNIYPQVDCMACEEISKCKKFFSKIPSSQALATDFFLQDLSPNIVYFLCPPVDKIIVALNKLLSYSGISALFVVPIWKAAIYWTEFKKLNGFKSFIKQYIIFQSKFVNLAEDSVFKDDANFKMIGFKILTP